ncbi:MAG TPA: ATP synthase F1 subunit epsilon [Actinomycetota bacterium]|nr:ATP synthase F1 subunit epsilon [Actinomycetota bacterium]
MSVPEHPPGALRTGNIADELARGQVDLHVTVVSPTAQIYAGAAHWVKAPGVDGLFGIWPRHVALVAALGGGILTIGLPGNQRLEFAVGGGFLEVSSNTVTVLVDHAVTEAEAPAHTAEAQAELEEVIAELHHPSSDAEFEELQERRSWSQARLKLAGRK